jgi:hypothetical protein
LSSPPSPSLPLPAAAARGSGAGGLGTCLLLLALLAIAGAASHGGAAADGAALLLLRSVLPPPPLPPGADPQCAGTLASATSALALSALASRVLRAADARLSDSSATVAGIVAELTGLPSRAVLEWLLTLRGAAAEAMASARDPGAPPCRVVSVTVGLYETGAQVAADRLLPLYDESGGAAGAERGCGIAFANTAFLELEAGSAEASGVGSNSGGGSDGGGGSGQVSGWQLVLIETEEEGSSSSLPFSSGSRKHDLQRAAHMIKTVAPLLFPCTELIVYGDSKCAVLPSTPLQQQQPANAANKAAESGGGGGKMASLQRIFPTRRMAKQAAQFPHAPLLALQNPSHFGRPLRLEFERTWTHMQNRREAQSVFEDMSRLETLLRVELDTHVPMIDAICMAFRPRGGINASVGAASASMSGGAAANDSEAAARVALFWTALVEGFSMREQLSFHAAAGLALAAPGAFFAYPPGGGWQQEPPQWGRTEPPVFSVPFEAEGIVYLPFDKFFSDKER